MGREINLLKNYPVAPRDTKKRALSKTYEDRIIARKFGKEFFDGERKHGYGGFNYNKKFWGPVVPTFVEYWNLNKNSSILDIGCGKGFMLFDLISEIPGMNIAGIDISEYAIQNAKTEVKNFLQVGNATNLPFKDSSFDVVISINTIHNLEKAECALALKEISRVSKKNSYVTVDAYRSEEEKKKMFEWNLTAKTILSVDEWKKFFLQNDFKGDYYWFIP